jgi:hypothetical protein
LIHWQLTVLIFVNLCLMVIQDPNYQSKMDYGNSFAFKDLYFRA